MNLQLRTHQWTFNRLEETQRSLLRGEGAERREELEDEEQESHQMNEWILDRGSTLETWGESVFEYFLKKKLSINKMYNFWLFYNIYGAFINGFHSDETMVSFSAQNVI